MIGGFLPKGLRKGGIMLFEVKMMLLVRDVNGGFSPESVVMVMRSSMLRR